MDTQSKILRAGTFAILFAVVLRLLSPYWSQGFWPFFVFLQTGRLVTVSDETTPAAEAPTLPAAATAPPLDLSKVTIQNDTGYALDLQALWETPVSLSLQTGEPAVLILHTHGSESYVKTEDYQESSAYRTENTDYNVVSVGSHLATLLESHRIRVLHDESMHDLPSYNIAYETARLALDRQLQENTTLQLVLDLHRDAAVDSSGNQVRKTVETPQGTAAQLMLVIGTDSGGLTHKNWRANLALAIRLQAQLEALCPGICRPIQLRTSRYNQDLSPGALLIEVGSAGNTRQEALLSAQYLAQAIAALSE